MTADMDKYCVMGNPVEHSKSPWIHARFAQLTGQPLAYGKQLVALDGFGAGLRAFRAAGGRGCNITVPFKFEAAPLASTLTPRARLAQACNTLRFDGERDIFADNTDGIGLVDDLQGNAGVALSAIALDAGPGKFDILVNATASSLSGGGVPVPANVLKPGALAVDMMYGPAADGFMAWAREHGAVPRDGLGMLVEQAAEAFLVFRGVRPPSAQVLAELRATLA